MSRLNASTGSLGLPRWLAELLRDAGWDTNYVYAVEIGGRGVLHPRLGWIRLETLRELAYEENYDNEK